MVNKCVVVGCETNYDPPKKSKKRNADGKTVNPNDNEDEKVNGENKKHVGIFHFPQDENLKMKWIKYLHRGDDYKPSHNSCICSLHFEEIFLIKGKQRMRLDYSLDPVPTIYPEGYVPQSTLLPSSSSKEQRKPPKDRTIPDEYDAFLQKDKILSFEQLDKDCAPFRFEFNRFDDHIVYFRLEFNTNFVPVVKESIVVDKDLCVKLFYEGSPVPLPEWFRYGHLCILSRIRMHEKFPPYIMNRG